jgi:predicted ester cyclase
MDEAMVAKSNKAKILAHMARINSQDLDGAEADLAVDITNHSAIPAAKHGRAGYRGILTKLLKAFPDLQMVCDDVIAEGDKVVCRLTFSGTNTGPLDFAKMPLPATGKRFVTTHIHIYRLKDGLIAERWAERDDVAMFRQLGYVMMPAPASTSSSDEARQVAS